MTENLRTTVATLREFVATLRTTYHADIKGRTVRDIHCDPTRAQRVDYSRTRLAYLVPLYKAMNSAAQQAGTGAVGGVKLYTKQFERLGRLIRAEVDYHHEKYFGDVVGELRILVPAEGVPVENWPTATITEVIAQVKQQLADERNAAIQRARNAEQARTAFLASLNEDQRALLRHALEVALAKGSHAISVDLRDLAA